jgi:hypothetical protein
MFWRNMSSPTSLLAACFILVSHLAFSSAFRVEAIYSSEMFEDSTMVLIKA